jgi:2-C-methyl-D-erythritol 4-phosphate cytidylyltransferase/2-C-methyl-D-erythritol 2,4-cyclodiphosphate synthase
MDWYAIDTWIVIVGSLAAIACALLGNFLVLRKMSMMGDAISHAICDALLSAAGLGDIGSRFGVDDPRFADARGEVFLTETLGLVRDAGFDVVNVAVQVVAARPRFAARRHEVEALLSRLLGAPVSVAATTSDGLGFTGRREGLTAIATALLSS